MTSAASSISHGQLSPTGIMLASSPQMTSAMSRRHDCPNLRRLCGSAHGPSVLLPECGEVSPRRWASTARRRGVESDSLNWCLLGGWRTIVCIDKLTLVRKVLLFSLSSGETIMFCEFETACLWCGTSFLVSVAEPDSTNESKTSGDFRYRCPKCGRTEIKALSIYKPYLCADRSPDSVEANCLA